MDVFRPPFCARRGCVHHEPSAHAPYLDYVPWGSYPTKAFGRVPRYRCAACGKTFSRQTFRLDYYAKRVLPYEDLVHRLSSCESLSAIGRAHRSSTDTISNRLSRAAKQALAFGSELASRLKPDEDLAADGFESFCGSQYFPNNITLLVGSSSQYVYAADHVTLRRKGRMTERQKSRRAGLDKRWRPDPRGIEKSFARIALEALRVCGEGNRSPLTLWTDEHPAYGRALASSSHLSLFMRAGFLVHRKVSSKLARTSRNPLFAVNYLDRELRKDLHEHVRETVCFGRNVNRQMERLAVYLLWHNTIKPHRARGEPRRNAEIASDEVRGLERGRKGMWEWRAWRSLTELSDSMIETWERLRATPPSYRRDYLPGYALM